METEGESAAAKDDFTTLQSNAREPEMDGASDKEHDSPGISRCSSRSYNPADFRRAYEIEEFMSPSFQWPDSARSSFAPPSPGTDNINRETQVNHPGGRGNAPMFRTPKIRFAWWPRSKPADPLLNQAAIGDLFTYGKPADPLLNRAAVGDPFTYEQLFHATSGFGEANLIRRGHSGDLYHGTLNSGTRVVVKRVDLGGRGEAAVKMEAACQAELDLFGSSSHPRLVPLLGWVFAHDEEEKLLVYKHMPNGDLASSLSSKATDGVEGLSLNSPDWLTRSKIAIGIAEAISYLHHDCTPPIVHRDIQASSILLDDKFEVRLGSLSEVSRSPASPAPCTYDVSCLGKVLLELVTRRLGISRSSDSTATKMLRDILPYINIHDKELLVNILNPSLTVDEDLVEEVWAMAIVAKSCLNSKPSKRPLVKYVLVALENPQILLRILCQKSGETRRAKICRHDLLLHKYISDIRIR